MVLTSRPFLVALTVLSSMAMPVMPATASSESNAPVLKAEDQPANLDFKKGKWGDLAQYIGTYRYDDVLRTPDVKAALDKLLDGTNVDLNKELSVRNPIGFDAGCIVLEGSQEHSADTNGTYMNICLQDGSVHLAVFGNNAVRIYSTLDQYQYMSSNMRLWIYQRLTPALDLDQRPDKVQMVVQPR